MWKNQNLNFRPVTNLLFILGVIMSLVILNDPSAQPRALALPIMLFAIGLYGKDS